MTPLRAKRSGEASPQPHPQPQGRRRAHPRLRHRRLQAMAYIVTFGTSREEAEKEPHAVSYDEYVNVEGVPIPTRWTFWMWSEEQGVQGKPIGKVILEDPSFVEPEAGAFGVPEDARKEELPRPSGG